MAAGGLRAWGAPVGLCLSLLIAGGGAFAALSKPPSAASSESATSHPAPAVRASTTAAAAPPTTGPLPPASPSAAGPTGKASPPPASSADPTPPQGSPPPASSAASAPTGETPPPEDANEEPSSSTPEEGVQAGGAETDLVEQEDSADPAFVGPVDCSVAACVALTFDDGPDANTKGILKVLADRQVHATFFVLGNRVGANAKILRRTAAQGHVIGNHSWSHPILTSLSPKQIRLQLVKTAKTVKEVTGEEATLVRPPYGLSSSKVSKVAKAVGSPLVFWDVDARDWETKSGKKIMAHIKKEVRPGSIILMHDSKRTTAKHLGSVIDYLHEKGYTLVTVPELLGEAKAGRSYRHR